MSFYGLLNLPWWGYLVVALVLTHITMVSVTIYLHRASAHRAVELSPIMSHFFRFWLWLTTGMKTKEWVAVHRRHHAFSDSPGDPHSPVLEGISNVLWRGAELYRANKKDKTTIEKYGKGTPDDWLERRVYSTAFLRGKLGVILMLVVDLLLFGGPGLIIWGVQMAWTPFFAAGVINGLGHWFGYRNFECGDAATNIFPIGILIAGEELHNNHHAYGTSARLSVKWWEFDIGWFYINVMRLFGLAKVKRVFPKTVLQTQKHDIDIDTVKAVVTNRLQLLASYSSQVIKPVFKAERKSTYDHRKYQALSRHVKTLLIRNKCLINNEDEQSIKQALAQSHALAVVCQYRDKLQAIWGQTTASQKELLDALQEWCRQAEQSGIDALQNFVAYVKAFHIRQFSA